MADPRQEPLDRLAAAVRILESCREFAALVPEVRVNFGCCLPDARTVDDVAAIDGRLTVVAGAPKASGPVRFGASDHLARRILEFRRHDESIRTALNFRWNESILEFVERWCREHGIELGALDRRDEPAELVGRDRSSMPWKVDRLVESCGGSVPEVLYEGRGWGKEPLFILTGSEPAALAERAVDIARGYARAR